MQKEEMVDIATLTDRLSSAGFRLEQSSLFTDSVFSVAKEKSKCSAEDLVHAGLYRALVYKKT